MRKKLVVLGLLALILSVGGIVVVDRPAVASNENSTTMHGQSICGGSCCTMWCSDCSCPDPKIYCYTTVFEESGTWKLTIGSITGGCPLTDYSAAVSANVWCPGHGNCETVLNFGVDQYNGSEATGTTDEDAGLYKDWLTHKDCAGATVVLSLLSITHGAECGPCPVILPMWSPPGFPGISIPVVWLVKF